MAPRTIAVDCDLRRIHAWDSESGKVCYRSPDIGDLLRHVDQVAPKLVLYEIASATDYTDAHSAAIRYNKRRWMLYNMYTAGTLYHMLAIRGVDMLVSPSQLWTKGYSEEQRKEIAKCDASNHDLRECQAMLFFHSNSPKQWTPLTTFLQRL